MRVIYFRKIQGNVRQDKTTKRNVERKKLNIIPKEETTGHVDRMVKRVYEVRGRGESRPVWIEEEKTPVEVQVITGKKLQTNTVTETKNRKDKWINATIQGKKIKSTHK